MWHLEGRPKVHDSEVPLPPGDLLHQESVTYQRELPRLLAEGGEGKYVLIKGDEIIPVFEDLREALGIGYSKYLNQPFMVQPIRKWEPVMLQTWRFRPVGLSESLRAMGLKK